MRAGFFCVITHRVVVFLCRRFRTTCRSHIHGSRIQKDPWHLKMGPIGRPETSAEITANSCWITQKNAYLGPKNYYSVSFCLSIQGSSRSLLKLFWRWRAAPKLWYLYANVCFFWGGRGATLNTEVANSSEHSILLQKTRLSINTTVSSWIHQHALSNEDILQFFLSGSEICFTRKSTPLNWVLWHLSLTVICWLQ